MADVSRLDVDEVIGAYAVLYDVFGLELTKGDEVVLDALSEYLILVPRDKGLEAWKTRNGVRSHLLICGVVPEEIDRKGLVHEDQWLVIVDADLNSFEEPFRTCLEWDD